MKIGILTFHNAHNYGAVLQAYALKKKISDLGHDVKIVNYRNSNIDKKYERKLNINISLSDFRHPQKLKEKLFFKRNIPYMQPAWEKQNDKFNFFINRYLIDSDFKVVTISELEKSDYDALIVGSDQVWTSWITGGLDPVYLLDFKIKGKKISYAASLFGGKIVDIEKDIFQRCLNEFDYISVRENSLKESIIKTCNCKAITVLDPTLLIDCNYYEEIETKKTLCDKKYVFAYFIKESDELMKCAEKIAKDSGFELLELHYYMQKKYANHNQIADIGPSEFLWYIKNAQYVVTNSFHGTVFSILYKRNFFSVYKEDSRIDNLLKALKLEKQHIVGSEQIDINKNIIFTDITLRLENLRHDSVEFLENSLK